jgi:PAS domain S-box-containing protein
MSMTPSDDVELDVFDGAEHRRCEAVFEATPVAIWVTEGDTVLFANRACRELFGVESLVGRSAYSLFSQTSHDLLGRYLADDSPTPPLPSLQERIVRHDGATRDVEIAAARLPATASRRMQVVFADITTRQLEKQQIEDSRRELRELSAGLEKAREEDQRRIARELHDELGQRLTALKLELAALRLSRRGDTDGDARIARMLSMVDEAVASVRRTAKDLRPLMLDDLGLRAAIENLAREAADRMGIAITVRLGEHDPPVGSNAAIALYRMVQEALTNVARHARATDVDIRMGVGDEGELVLSVEDNGVGFGSSAHGTRRSLGLLGMKERATRLGGRIEVGNVLGGGARVAVYIPLSTETDAGEAGSART